MFGVLHAYVHYYVYVYVYVCKYIMHVYHINKSKRSDPATTPA